MLYRIIIVLTLPFLLLAHAGECASCGGCSGRLDPTLGEETLLAEPEHCHWLEVTSVVEGGAAEALDVKPGDVIVSYNGSTVGCLDDLLRVKSKVKTDSIELVLRRGEEELTMNFPAGQLGVYLHEWRNDIKPDPDAVIIDGIPPLTWSSGKTGTFMAALEAVVAQAGGNADYVFLSGVSGAAFRTHFHRDWCPSSPDPACGYEATKPALAACGYEATAHCVSTDGKNKPGILAAFMASVDSGIPVLAGDLIELPEWGIITGYQKQGEELFCRTFFDKRKGYELAQKFPFVSLVLTKTGTVPEPMHGYFMSFGIVAENLSEKQYDAYYSGLAAFDYWTEQLRTADFAAMDSMALSTAVQTNYWTFNRLVEDRKTGVEYLDRVAEALPHLKPSLDELTNLYNEEIETLGPVLEQLPCPGTCTKAEQWTQELKDLQIEALAKARAIEEKALPTWQQLAATE